MLRLIVMKEAGFDEAMVGLSLSYNKDPADMLSVAERLAFKGGGHNKFLESIVVWLDITAPRYWWQQCSTYRVGTSTQSESTMHTLLNRYLRPDDFAVELPDGWLEKMNSTIKLRAQEPGVSQYLKAVLPESFMQRRVVCTNYMTLQRMVRQRAMHKIEEWHEFIGELLCQVERPQFVVPLVNARERLVEQKAAVDG